MKGVEKKLIGPVGDDCVDSDMVSLLKKIDSLKENDGKRWAEKSFELTTEMRVSSKKLHKFAVDRDRFGLDSGGQEIGQMAVLIGATGVLKLSIQLQQAARQSDWIRVDELVSQIELAIFDTGSFWKQKTT